MPDASPSFTSFALFRRPAVLIGRESAAPSSTAARTCTRPPLVDKQHGAQTYQETDKYPDKHHQAWGAKIKASAKEHRATVGANAHHQAGRKVGHRLVRNSELARDTRHSGTNQGYVSPPLSQCLGFLAHFDLCFLASPIIKRRTV